VTLKINNQQRESYGWGVRVHRHFGARGMSSVRYGTRLGDLKNKQSTERELGSVTLKINNQQRVRYRTRLGDLKNKQSTESLMSAGIGYTTTI
jgi:hypothetical protein